MGLSLMKRQTQGYFQHIAIVESDSQLSYLMQEYSQDAGCAMAEVFEEGLSFQNSRIAEFDLVVLDWSLKGPTSAVALYNRLRSRPALQSIPVIVVSGFVDRRDFRLFDEFPLTRLVEKPFTSGVFIEAIDSLEREKSWLKKHESNLLTLIQAGEGRTSQGLHKILRCIQQSPHPRPLLFVMGKLLAKEKLWEESQFLFQTVLHEDPDNILAINELGKSLHMQGHHAAALRLLERAQIYSPDNVKRLCEIGELHLQTLDADSAERSFHAALRIDPSLLRAKAGAQLAHSVAAYLRSREDESAFPHSFASLMNTLGITKVRNGHLGEGIDHYQSALMFIRNNDERAKVMFNMGLGYLRHQQSEKALFWFVRSAKTGGKLFLKAHQYVQAMSTRVILTEEGLRVTSSSRQKEGSRQKNKKRLDERSSAMLEVIQDHPNDPLFEAYEDSYRAVDLLFEVEEEGFN